MASLRATRRLLLLSGARPCLRVRANTSASPSLVASFLRAATFSSKSNATVTTRVVSRISHQTYTASRTRNRYVVGVRWSSTTSATGSKIWTFEEVRYVMFRLGIPTYLPTYLFEIWIRAQIIYYCVCASVENAILPDVRSLSLSPNAYFQRSVQ
jgi:hypothetical protein